MLLYFYYRRDRYKVNPESVYKAKNILSKPNTYDAFKSHVCDGTGNKSCVDAITYMDSKLLLKNGKFTIENIKEVVK